MPLVLEELENCLAGTDNVEKTVETGVLTEAIDAFLSTIPAKNRKLFVCRYWYTDSIAAIAARFGMKESTVAMNLSRTRAKLRVYLTERGFLP